MTRRFHVLIFCLMALLISAVPAAFAQTNNGVGVEVFEINDEHYPQVEAYFSAVDLQRGRVLDLNAETVQVQVGGQVAEVTDFEVMPGTNRPVHLVVVIDLTSSQNFTNFLDEQKRTAQSLIDELTPSDYVGIVTFDTNVANVAYPISYDHNGALNTLDDLAIVQGPSNQFRDGVHTALQQLQAVSDPDARKVTVVLTDVTNPQGTATLNDSLTLATQVNAPIYMIGFNDAEESFLVEYTSATGGFTYMQRELEEELGGLARLAQNVGQVITQEYMVRFNAPLDATNSQQPMELAVNLGGASGSTTHQVVTRTRAINIAFPNIDPNEPVSDAVTFEPVITYADTGDPVPVTSAAYYILDSTLNDTVLNPPDTANPTYTWDIADIAGGSYRLRLDITDNVGNQADQIVTVNVASPITVAFVNPPPNANGAVDLPPGVQTVEVAVDGSYTVNDIAFFLDGEQVEARQQPQPPYIFEWDASRSAGAYQLRVEASDVRGNRAQAGQAVNVLIGTGTDVPLTLLLLIVLAVLIVLAGAAITISRRRKAAMQSPAPVGAPSPANFDDPTMLPTESVAPPPPQAGNCGQLVVMRGGVGVPAYPLQQGRYLVGRGRGANIRVSGLTASREHAEVTVMNGQITYQDLQPGKGNVSIINGVPLTGQRSLQEGDHIIVGDTELMYRRS